ncbi:MAG: MFS transporter [Halanaeroarchaeum sp.]
MRRVFRHPDFRRLFLGRLVTNAGDSVYAVAAMWLVYSLSGSTLYTGLAGALTMGPAALQAFVGPLVDRWSLRRTLVFTQATQAILVLVVPAAHALGVLSVTLVLVVMPVVALFNQFVYPAQNAALPRIVEEDELTTANSALSLAYQGVDMAFNGIAGILVVSLGAVTLYAVDSLTFVLAVALFAGLRVPRATAAEDEDSPPDDYLGDLREGIGFVRGTVIAKLFGASVMANALLGITWAVLPAFADSTGDAGAYGLLLAGISGGTLVGSLVATRFDTVPYGKLSIAGFTLASGAWFGALLAPWFSVTLVLFGAAFVPVGVTNVVSATMLQRLIPDSLLGRVMALLGSMSTAAMPIGSLFGGAVGDVLGPLSVMYLGGVGFLWIVAYVLFVPALRDLPAATAVEGLSQSAHTREGEEGAATA